MHKGGRRKSKRKRGLILADGVGVGGLGGLLSYDPGLCLRIWPRGALGRVCTVRGGGESLQLNKGSLCGSHCCPHPRTPEAPEASLLCPSWPWPRNVPLATLKARQPLSSPRRCPQQLALGRPRCCHLEPNRWPRGLGGSVQSEPETQARGCSSATRAAARVQGAEAGGHLRTAGPPRRAAPCGRGPREGGGAQGCGAPGRAGSTQL